MKNVWTDYLTRNSLLRTLCRWRAESAWKRAPLQCLWSVVNGLEDPVSACPDNISSYLPSRRQWIRIGTKERRRIGENALIEMTVYRTARRMFTMCADEEERPEWINAFESLRNRIDSLRHSPEITFHPPILHLIPKGKGSERRCLASFDEVEDRLLLSKAALYLRDTFDPLLSDDCFAFRRDGAFNYQSAIEDLIRYRMRYSGRRIYVAECDIQRFFDVINQDLVLKAYDTFVGRLEMSERPPEELRTILAGYLNAFTSQGNLIVSTDPKIVDFRHLVKPLDQTDVFKFYRKRERKTVRLGIPQGGALSPLIANLVLDEADRAVREDDDPELFYVRFCDDIIIAHPDRTKCRAALDRYMSALKVLKLPTHPVNRRVTFGREYYDMKSKGPFPWQKPSAKSKNIPWVAFLGVHIRYDGLVRVRKDSIERHAEHLRRELKRFKEAVGPNGRNLKNTTDEAKESLLRAFEARLTAMGTGYSTMRQRTVGTRSWIAAFPALTQEGPARGQMRHLDSVRGHQVSALKKRLGFSEGQLPSGKKGYYGRPYSYYGALLDVEKHQSFPPDPKAYSTW